MARMNQLMRSLLPARQWTTMKGQAAATAAGKGKEGSTRLGEPLENLSTFHARVICASRAADAAIV